MANPKLTVEIDGDISKLQKEITAANKLLAQHERNYAGVQKAIASNTQTTRNLERQLSQLNNEFKSGAVSEKQYARETDRLNAELRDVNSSTANYQRELKRLQGEMMRAKNSTDSYNKSSAQTQNTTARTTQAIGGMAKTTRVNAVPAMTSFSQVIQDAPYGIQGVANNIQQLTMQMGYLSNNAGGAQGAFKALVGSLVGPAGILLAVSALTSGMIALQSSGITLTDVLNTIRGESTKLAREQRKLAESYREAQGEVMGEVEVLKSLIAIARDETRSRAEKQRAIDSVNDKFPELHENLRLETVGSQKATEAVDNLTKSLLRQAKIQGLQGAISEVYAELSEVAEKSALDSAAWYEVLGSMFTPGGSFTAAIEAGAKRQGKEYDQLQGKLQRYSETLQALIGEDIQLKGVFTNVDTSGAGGAADKPIRVPITPVLDFSAGQGTASRQLDSFIQKELSRLQTLQKAFAPLSDEYILLGQQIGTLEDRLSRFQDSLSNSANTSLEEFSRLAAGMSAINEEQQARMEEQSKMHAERQQMLAGIVSQSFSAMGGELIEAVSQGKTSMKDLTSIVLQSVARMMSAILAQALGNAVLGATQSSLGAGPGAAFVLPGLLGATLGAVKSSFPAFQDGGIVGGSSMFGDKIFARLNSKEAVFNTDQQRAIWGQMNSAPASGNSAPIEVQGEFVLEGENLRVALERNNRTRGRQT